MSASNFSFVAFAEFGVGFDIIQFRNVYQRFPLVRDRGRTTCLANLEPSDVQKQRASCLTHPASSKQTDSDSTISILNAAPCMYARHATPLTACRLLSRMEFSPSSKLTQSFNLQSGAQTRQLSSSHGLPLQSSYH